MYCDICYRNYKRINGCFWGCSITICLECISKLIRLSKSSGYVYMECPQCRRHSFNTYDSEFSLDKTVQEIANEKFTRLCSRRRLLVFRIFDMLKNKVCFEEDTILLLPGQLG